MAEDIKVKILGEEPIVEEPEIPVSQSDVVVNINPDTWVTLTPEQKTATVTTLVDENMNTIVAAKTNKRILLRIITNELAAYRALDETYRLKRIALEKKYAIKKENLDETPVI